MPGIQALQYPYLLGIGIAWGAANNFVDHFTEGYFLM